jgi:hypothetical protein
MTDQQHPAAKSPAVDDKKLADDKKKLAEEREAREKAAADREKHRGTPTPTQEEVDLVKLGHHIDLAKDGSPEEGVEQREAAAGGRAAYETRQLGSKPQEHAAPPPVPPKKP